MWRSSSCVSIGTGHAGGRADERARKQGRETDGAEDGERVQGGRGTDTGISLGVYGRDTNESNKPPSEQTETV